jgi:hypothetical protein
MINFPKYKLESRFFNAIKDRRFRTSNRWIFTIQILGLALAPSCAVFFASVKTHQPQIMFNSAHIGNEKNQWETSCKTALLVNLYGVVLRRRYICRSVYEPGSARRMQDDSTATNSRRRQQNQTYQTTETPAKWQIAGISLAKCFVLFMTSVIKPVGRQPNQH